MDHSLSAPTRTVPAVAAVSRLAAEVARRRTFAIISHPDAGKTTLTEKLLLFGGAINLAGQVKAKRDRRTTRSDWMKIERERGISVVTSVMTFEYDGTVFNLLDTPGHEDFSEDTYRTLTAVDSAVMVIDAAAVDEEFAIVREACRPFDLVSFREGHLTPVFFGSALKTFGVGDLLDGFAAYAPPPRAQDADVRRVEADEVAMTAFVFKIQANMDPNHRDRIAFARLCSGKLTRGMKAKHVRTAKSIGLHSPHFFFAQDRAIADEAFAGDVVGIPNHGSLRIGDTLTEGETLNFVGVPTFAPAIIRRVRLTDAMKAKKLKQALQEMAEEGGVQVFRPTDGSPALIGA